MSNLSGEKKLDSPFKPASFCSKTGTISEASIDE
jgi:hypothetical protein